MYLHHRLHCDPLAWQAAAERLSKETRPLIEQQGGKLYGIWRSQIGRPRDELTVITEWPDRDAALRSKALFGTLAGVRHHSADAMRPTVRPMTSEPPRRQGNYAFRWFDTPAQHWDEFLELCQGAWPDFEAAYDSQIIGLWRITPDEGDNVRSLLITRRPDLAMWERSKLPANPSEAEVRRKLSRRYDLCTDTVVSTSTLLTAEDRADTARWT